MRKTMLASYLLLGCLGIGGCETTGESPRTSAVPIGVAAGADTVSGHVEDEASRDEERERELSRRQRQLDYEYERAQEAGHQDRLDRYDWSD